MADGTVKIRIAATPAGGAANRALVEFLGQALGIAGNQIDIIAGETSQRKLIALVGISPDEVDAVFQNLIPSPRPARAASRRKPK